MKTQIFNWLWLGNNYDAMNIAQHPSDRLKGKWLILNVLEPELVEGDLEETIIPILYKKEGKYYLDWNKVFEAGDWIEKQHIEHPDMKILCHCGACQERSPLTMQYYLVRYHNMTPDQAFDFIKQKRPDIFRCDKNYIW